MIQITYTGTVEKDWVESLDTDGQARDEFFDTVLNDIRESVTNNRFLFSQIMIDENPNLPKGKVMFLLNASILPELADHAEVPGEAGV